MQKKTVEEFPVGVCPFVASPSKDCYCVEMNSDRIRNVVKFCMGNYLECKIYRRLSGRQKFRTREKGGWE
ncbi:MAG: hypothetical protein GWP10_19360 [Nitrospiraceae bacterium]|nr:hypothetical protein [Nitrospiraceae bacterium]